LIDTCRDGDEAAILASLRQLVPEFDTRDSCPSIAEVPPAPAGDLIAQARITRVS
jgi:hypothetical protein